MFLIVRSDPPVLAWSVYALWTNVSCSETPRRALRPSPGKRLGCFADSTGLLGTWSSDKGTTFRPCSSKARVSPHQAWAGDVGGKEESEESKQVETGRAPLVNIIIIPSVHPCPTSNLSSLLSTDCCSAVTTVALIAVEVWRN